MTQRRERRCLTYLPTKPAGWQVEMGDVGQHYFQWRYGGWLRECRRTAY